MFSFGSFGLDLMIEVRHWHVWQLYWNLNRFLCRRRTRNKPFYIYIGYITFIPLIMVRLPIYLVFSF